MNEFYQSLNQDPLTERELEILILMSAGLSNQEIAAKLYLALETIRWYSKRIYSKMQVRNRTQAAARARELGLIKEKSLGFHVPSDPLLPRHNLPAQVTAFIGRGIELEDLTQRLNQKNTRLITILAPGGMGKTRLAVQIGKACLPNFSDGVFFIPLAHLSSKDHIVPAIAENLQIQLTMSEQPAQQLQAFLRDKEMLLVIDSFEHLLAGTELISTLLEGASGLKALVTTRERLELQGEMIYKLNGLEIPEAIESTEVIESSAVKLFIQSARLVHPNFSLETADQPHVARVCWLLEGMPLGIILAAAWVEVLSIGEIAGEIANNLDFLQSERRDVPLRQRSIRAVFEYSLHKLDEKARLVFYKLSVFRGGFNRLAAEAIAGAKLESLAFFVRKSLLQHDPVSKRYRLHELLRQYASEKLVESGFQDTTHLAHMTYFTDLMVQLEVGIKGNNQVVALNQIQVDFENIRFTWHQAISNNHSAEISRALECLYWFCNMRGRVPSGEGLLTEARNRFINTSDLGDSSCDRRLLLRFNASGDDYKILLEEAVKFARQYDPKTELAFLLWAYGVNAYAMQDYERAITSLEESLGIYHAQTDPFYSVEVLHLLWICTRFMGAFEAANQYYDRALTLSRKTGNKIAVGRALGSRGALEFFGGDYSTAETLIREALEVRLEIEDDAGVSMSMAFLGWLASIRGDIEQGKSFAESSLKIATEIHNLNSKTTAMNTLGWIACLEGDFEKAKRFCEESQLLAPDPTIVLEAEIVLALATCGLEDYQASKTYLRKVVSLTTAVGGQGLLMCLPIMAIILGNEGKKEQAVEILSLAVTHEPSAIAWMTAWEPLSTFQENLENELGQEVFQLSWARGKSLELEEVGKEFIKAHFLKRSP